MPRLIIVVAIFFALPIPAYAVTPYFWQYTDRSGPSFSSISAACEAARADFQNSYGSGYTVTFTGTTTVDSTHSSCGYKVVTPNGVQINKAQGIYRSGDGCLEGYTYDPAKGSCNAPSPDAGKVCDPQKGSDGFIKIIDSDGGCVSMLRADLPAQCKYLGDSEGIKEIRFKTQVKMSGEPVAPPEPAYKGCEVNFLTAAVCKYKPSTPSGSGVYLPEVSGSCSITYQFTGKVSGDSKTSLGAADLPSGKEGICAGGMDSSECGPETPTESKENNPCIYSVVTSGATGTTSSCVSSSFAGEPGDMKCGQVDGKNVCVTNPTKAEASNIQTTVKTTPNSDGSSTSVKTDVATKTSCPSGASTCKVTTTTTTTTTHKNADGSVAGTSTQTTCQGAECSSTGTGGGGGGNKGKGDETTNCDPATDPKACEGASTDGGGKKCNAPIQCDGDAVMCAILQQQHKDTCELMAEPSDEEKSKFEQDKAAEISKVDAFQDELDDKASGLFADFQAKASGNQYGGQCLADKQVEVFGSTFTLPLSQICPYLALLRYALIAMAYLAAARIVSRGI